MYYLIAIFISIIITVCVNLLFFLPFTVENLILTAGAVCIGAVAAFAIDGISAFILRRLTPKSWYRPNRRIFTVSKKEKNFYNKLKIKSWKDKVPELGGFTSFHKNELKSESDPVYLERFILEANYGVIIHIANALLGVLIVFIPFCNAPSVCIPVIVVNFILSILPVFILRYTSYTLLRLYNRSIGRK